MTTSTPVRSEGQWALGDHTPLNPNEAAKLADHPLNVRERIESTYARDGFASIDPGDLRGRFRWWGLYTQRAPGMDATMTGTDDETLLDAHHFMLRVRIDGGALSTGQLRTVAAISTEFARDTADLTDRQNIQLHWIRIEDVPEIWRRLESVGLSTTQACGDCPRVVLGSPLAGLAVDEVLDPTWAIEEIQRRYIGDPEYANLPRKFKTAISGLPDVVHEVNDVAFIGVVHPEHGPGLDVSVGGGLSTNPMLAQRLGAWVPLAEVPEVWAAIVALFRDHGYRRLRSRARIKFLVRDWGAAQFRRVLETEYLQRPLLDGPAPERPARPRDHVGVQRQRDGRMAVGVAPVAGRLTGTRLTAVADAVEAAGSARVRLTPHQKLVVLDVAPGAVDHLTTTLGGLGLPAQASPWRRGVMACSGIEFCKLAFTETRTRAQTLVPELEQRLADLDAELDAPVSIHLNGCPNSCARIQTADIGLKGMVVPGADGGYAEGFQVHLGGELGLETGFGRKLRQHRITTDEIGGYVERVVRAYAAGREPGERFAAWAARADEEALR